MKKMLVALVICLVLLPALLATAQETVRLPRPQQRIVSFEDVINKVRTDRAYSEKSIDISDLSYVLWAAAGGRFNVDAVSGASKTYPSAFGIYPVKVYVLAGNVEAVKPGIYQYNPDRHELKLLKGGDHRAEMVVGAPYGGFAAQAPATVVPAVDFERASGSWAEQEKAVLFPVEVGFLAQTMRLAATAAGFSVGIVGGFDSARIKTLFGIKEEPLLLLPLGYTF